VRRGEHLHRLRSHAHGGEAVRTKGVQIQTVDAAIDGHRLLAAATSLRVVLVGGIQVHKVITVSESK
jgi:hypothetical protein